jgi:methylenetetrahydrofolate reductase (NADPH)
MSLPLYHNCGMIGIPKVGKGEFIVKITEVMSKRMCFSFELFPPKTDKGDVSLCKEGGTLDKLMNMQPDYISCTYGAGGSNVGRQMQVLDAIKSRGTVPVAHFTCVGNTKEGLRAQLSEYLEHGVDHVLALRGDLPFGWTGTGGDLHYATELVRFIRKEFGDKFTIACAGSPEGHIACRSLEADISFLKQKQDEGADYIMTQLCWDMDAFRRWLDAIRRAGITMPIDAGIMPVLDQAATINMALSRNGCVLPRELSEIISRNWIFPNPFAPAESEESMAAKKAAFRQQGLEYTVRLIDRYRACGVNGIHLYALNKAADVTELVKMSGIIDR